MLHSQPSQPRCALARPSTSNTRLCGRRPAEQASSCSNSTAPSNRRADSPFGKMRMTRLRRRISRLRRSSPFVPRSLRRYGSGRFITAMASSNPLSSRSMALGALAEYRSRIPLSNSRAVASFGASNSSGSWTASSGCSLCRQASRTLRFRCVWQRCHEAALEVPTNGVHKAFVLVRNQEVDAAKATALKLGEELRTAVLLAVRLKPASQEA